MILDLNLITNNILNLSDINYYKNINTPIIMSHGESDLVNFEFLEGCKWNMLN